MINNSNESLTPEHWWYIVDEKEEQKYSKRPLDNLDIQTLKALHDTIHFVNKTGTRSYGAKILSTNILLNALGIKFTFNELNQLWNYFN